MDIVSSSLILTDLWPHFYVLVWQVWHLVWVFCCCCQSTWKLGVSSIQKWYSSYLDCTGMMVVVSGYWSHCFAVNWVLLWFTVVKKEVNQKAKLSVYFLNLTHSLETGIRTDRMRIQLLKTSFFWRLARLSLYDRLRSSKLNRFFFSLKGISWSGWASDQDVSWMPPLVLRACITGGRPQGFPRAHWNISPEDGIITGNVLCTLYKERHRHLL